MELGARLLAAFTGKPMPDQLAPAPDSGTPAGEAAPPSPTNPDGTPNWSTILGGFHDQLLAMATQGWEPDYCAELVLRVLPPDYTGMLNEFLAKPQDEALQILTTAIPELRGYTKWTPDFLSALRDIASDKGEG